MMLIRPIAQADLPFILKLAAKAGTGLTTLPRDEASLLAKINDSADSLDAEITQPGEQSYLFVLENTEDGSIVGTSALVAAVGLADPFYTYKVSHTVNASRGLDKYRHHDVLVLGNDYTACSEICTLFLDPDFRKHNNGKLLSKSRFLFMAEYPERFARTVIAEMRGVSDSHGISPFWESLGRFFFDMDFADADRLSGLGNSQFIGEFMPKHPIYTALLSEAAQAVIGQVHQETRPALKMLQREGFHYRNYVDIFDAGPTIEADVENIDTVANNHRVTVTEIQEVAAGKTAMIANTCLDFRATVAKVQCHNGVCQIDASTAKLLNVDINDPIRVYFL